jgi:hypothetical protein
VAVDKVDGLAGSQSYGQQSLPLIGWPCGQPIEAVDRDGDGVQFAPHKSACCSL